MKIKIGQLVASTQEINGQSSLGTLLLQKLPIRTTFKLRQVAKELSKELDTYNQTRIALLERVGTPDGGNYKINPDQQEEFNTEFGVLLQQEIEVPLEDKITVPDSIELSVQDLSNLDWLVQEPTA